MDPPCGTPWVYPVPTYVYVPKLVKNIFKEVS